MNGNEQQVEFWNGEAGRRWVENDAQLERAIGPLTPPLIERAGSATGTRALDIGCGCGNQTLALARHLGSGATVTGIDISGPMLALAAKRAAAVPSGAAALRFVLADASAHDFGADRFELFFSRFGVMFFADPVAAFRNLRGAAAAGARVVFCCWQGPAQNDWISLPMRAALRHLPAPAASDPHAPGPFAFADSARVEGILRQAGFGDVGCESWTTPLCFAEAPSLAQAADALVQAGPVGALLTPLDRDSRECAMDDIRAALAPSYRDGRLLLQSAVWLVSARAA